MLVVEDIVDSGLTLSYLQRYLLARQPASLEVCALLVKEGQQRTALDLRYVGFTIPPTSSSATGSTWPSVPKPAGHPRLRRPEALSRARSVGDRRTRGTSRSTR